MFDWKKKFKKHENTALKITCSLAPHSKTADTLHCTAPIFRSPTRVSLQLRSITQYY